MNDFSDSGAGSTEVLQNSDVSFSGQQKEEIKNADNEANDNLDNPRTDGKAFANTVLETEMSKATRGDGEENSLTMHNDEYKDLLTFPLAEKPKIFPGVSLNELLESPSKELSSHYLLEPNVILQSPLEYKAKQLLDDIVNYEVRKSSFFDGLELTLPPIDKPEHESLGSMFSTKVSLLDESGLQAAKMSHRTMADLGSSDLLIKKNVFDHSIPSPHSGCNVSTLPPTTVVYSRRPKETMLVQQAVVEVAIATDEATANYVKNVMASNAFKAAPDAPSFDLGLDSPCKSQGSITESMLLKVYDETMMKKGQDSASNQRFYVVPKIDTTHVSAEEEEAYNLLCRWRGKLRKSDSSPVIFQTKEVTATAAELANSMGCGKCLSTIAIHVGTSVLSKDPRQARKLIMSPWVSIFFPILQPPKSGHDASGHWFTFVINLNDNKFQVIDSLRLKGDSNLEAMISKFRVSVINLWHKHTSKVEGCTIPVIFKFKVHYVEGYRQFGVHDCGLFTIKAIELFDGKRAPEVVGCNELNLRMQILFQCLSSPSNKIDWKTVLIKEKHGKTVDKTSASLILNPLIFHGPSKIQKKGRHVLPENLLD